MNKAKEKATYPRIGYWRSRKLWEGRRDFLERYRVNPDGIYPGSETIISLSPCSFYYLPYPRFASCRLLFTDMPLFACLIYIVALGRRCHRRWSAQKMRMAIHSSISDHKYELRGTNCQFFSRDKSLHLKRISIF